MNDSSLEAISDIARQFPADDPLFEKPTPTGHFIAFFVRSKPLVQTLVPQIRKLGDTFGWCYERYLSP